MDIREKTANTPEPHPLASDGPAIWDLVIADMAERDRIGTAKYGQRLTAGDGRNSLVDAYQEVLDLAVYLRKDIEERKAHVLRSTEPLAGLTYDKIRKQQCKLCAAGIVRSNFAHEHSVTEEIQVYPSRKTRHSHIPCTAPTPEQVIEEQGREIARLHDDILKVARPGIEWMEKASSLQAELVTAQEAETESIALNHRLVDRLRDLRSQLVAAQQREKELGEQLARYGNPWTIAIQSVDGRWSEFCHDAPITLAEAEKRESALKTEHPQAVFRVLPWLNNSQHQHVRAELEQSSEARGQDVEQILTFCIKAASNSADLITAGSPWDLVVYQACKKALARFTTPAATPAPIVVERRGTHPLRVLYESEPFKSEYAEAIKIERAKIDPPAPIEEAPHAFLAQEMETFQCLCEYCNKGESDPIHTVVTAIAENATTEPAVEHPDTVTFTCVPAYDPKFPLWCPTCRSSLTLAAFDNAGGMCPVCGNGTVRDLTPADAARSAEVKEPKINDRKSAHKR